MNSSSINSNNSTPTNLKSNDNSSSSTNQNIFTNINSKSTTNYYNNSNTPNILFPPNSNGFFQTSNPQKPPTKVVKQKKSNAKPVQEKINNSTKTTNYSTPISGETQHFINETFNSIPRSNLNFTYSNFNPTSNVKINNQVNSNQTLNSNLSKTKNNSYSNLTPTSNLTFNVKSNPKSNVKLKPNSNSNPKPNPNKSFNSMSGTLMKNDDEKKRILSLPVWHENFVIPYEPCNQENEDSFVISRKLQNVVCFFIYSFDLIKIQLL